MATTTSESTVPAPKGPASATYRAVPADDGQTDPRVEHGIVPVPEAHRGCWEAFQDWTWSLELISLLFAIASTAAICIILGLWENQLLRDWPLPIQPNSLISIFSTLAKTALMLPLGSVISQMKWVWFEKPRALTDLQTFDRASRGPWGALKLIWDTKGKAWITKLACVLTVVALAFEPTAQQVLSFESRMTPARNATASLSIARNWTADSLQMGEKTYSTKNNNSVPNSNPKFECTAPSCHWDYVETLGACSQCLGGPRPALTLERNDTVSFIARSPVSITVGPKLTNGARFPNITVDPQIFRFGMDATTMMNMPDYSFLNFAAANWTDARNAAPDAKGWAWERNATVDYYLCRIHPCVQTFRNVTVRNGVYQNGTRTDKWLVRDDVASKALEAGDPSIMYRTEEDGTKAPSAPAWSVNFHTAERLNSVLGNMVSGQMPQRPRSLDFGRNGGLEFGITQYMIEHGPGVVMRALAEILSAQMRDEDNVAAQGLAGVALEPQTFIVVNWPWMACPLAILALTAATLVFAMVRNATRPLKYKDSAVALLSLGIGHTGSADQHVRENPLGQRNTAYQTEVGAAGLKAKVQQDVNGEYMFVRC
ncbi:uncharacterized protein PG998_005709 [Apiospora kogelbergensis]|uniref:uncharacterized protein n=1 Tax=Apiospora kogelbergensis TaxID=1337665 RepID=UPI0031325B0A